MDRFIPPVTALLKPSERYRDITTEIIVNTHGANAHRGAIADQTPLSKAERACLIARSASSAPQFATSASFAPVVELLKPESFVQYAGQYGIHTWSDGCANCYPRRST